MEGEAADGYPSAVVGALESRTAEGGEGKAGQNDGHREIYEPKLGEFSVIPCGDDERGRDSEEGGGRLCAVIGIVEVGIGDRLRLIVDDEGIEDYDAECARRKRQEQQGFIQPP